MTLECEPSRFDLHHMNTIHSETRTTAPRLASASTLSPPPPLLRGHDTLASLYKRYTTLNQQIRSTRVLLEQQQSENQHTLTLATARDRANGKLQRKLDQLSTAMSPTAAGASPSSSSPDSSLSSPPPPLTPSTKADLHARKQQCALVQDEYQQWQDTVQRHQDQLEKATFRTNQAKQQLLCLQHIHSSTTNVNNQQHCQRYQDLEMRHALLETLNAIRDVYVDSLDTMTTRWAWLLVTDNDDDKQQTIHTTPAATYMKQLDQLKQDYQHYLDQEQALQQQVDALAAAPDEEETRTL